MAGQAITVVERDIRSEIVGEVRIRSGIDQLRLRRNILDKATA